MEKTFPKTTGIHDFDQLCYYLEGKMEESSGDVLPSVSGTDNGKVLMVDSGKWAKKNITFPTELPAVTAENNGKILKVANGTWDIGSETVELPTVPTVAGNYFLKCVVAEGGTATLSWELQE